MNKELEIKKKSKEYSKLSTFYILYALYNFSDEERPLTVIEICRYLQTIGVEITDDTVRNQLRQIPAVISSGFEERDYAEIKEQYGFCVIEITGKPCRYYFDHTISKEEIVTLMDAVESYSYFTEDDVSRIVNKLASLRKGTFSKKEYVINKNNHRIFDDEKDSLLQKVHQLVKAIRKRICVSIIYCYYNEKKKLVPRKGYPKVVQPVRLIWSNGYYYLQVYNELNGNLINLRIDRISEIKLLDEKINYGIIEEIDENSVEYRRRHPVMFSGKETRITMLCKSTENNYIFNNVMDSFGKDSIIMKLKDDELIKILGHDNKYYKNLGEEWYKVSIIATEGGVKLWATQYSRDCVVISPESLRNEIKANLEAALGYYR